MAEKQKPNPKIVRKAARALKNPKSSAFVKSASARILDDQKNDPDPHKPKPRGAAAKSKPKTTRSMTKAVGRSSASRRTTRG
jgi:hypothetical protein